MSAPNGLFNPRLTRSSWRRRQWLAAAASLAAPAVVLGRTQVFHLSHVVATDTPKGQAMARFAELVRQKSQGRLQVQVFPQSQLYGDSDEVRALQYGAVQFIAPSLSKFGRIGLPEFELFDLPYAFANLAQVRRVTQGALGQRLLERLQLQGMVGLGYLDNGFKQLSASRPIREPADCAGLRMRIQASRVLADQMVALGARPVSMPFGETRLALERHVVDGTENPISNFYTQGMHLLQSDLALTHHGYLGYAAVTDARFWNQLLVPDRQLLASAMREALDWGNSVAQSQNEQHMQALLLSGKTRVLTLTAEQQRVFADKLQPVRHQLALRVGDQWLDQLGDALAS